MPTMSPAPTQQPTPSPQNGPTHDEAHTPRRTTGTKRRWAELSATALLAAVVATGTTVAVGAGDSNANAVGASTPVLAAAPSSSAGTDWRSVAANASSAVVAIDVTTQQGQAQGSGVVWDAQGNIVTNNHVVSGMGSGAQIQVRIGAQKTYAATIVGTDPTTDLAVIKLTSPPSGLTPISRASADSVKVGDPVMALGNPLGLSGTVTTGIVSALNRPVTTAVTSTQGSSDGFSPAAQRSTGQVVTDAIQTSAAINPGNSGGALVDGTGRLVGINSSIASLSSGSGMGGQGGEAGNIGIGFAIPIAEVNNVVGQLLSKGSVDHATLGVSIADAQVKQDAATVSGAGIRTVNPGSPAAAAGLKAGDLVTAVDGNPVDSADGLVGAIRGLKVGQQVKLTVLNGNGSSRQVTATLTGQSTQR